MKNPYEQLKALEKKELPNIQDVEILLSELGIECHQVGKYLKMKCPACEKLDKASLSRYEKTGYYTWRCWNSDCNIHEKVGGNLIGLVKATHGLNHEEALARIQSALHPQMS